MENDPIFFGAKGFVHRSLYIQAGEMAEKEGHLQRLGLDRGLYIKMGQIP
jgi:hypothetical protein